MSASDFKAYQEGTVASANPSPPRIVRAKVTEAPASSSDLATVAGLYVLDDFGRVALGDAPWPKPAGKELPEVGDECTVAIDDTGQVCIVGWSEPGWPGAGSAAAGWEAGDLKQSARTSCGSEWLGPCVGQEVSAATFPSLAAVLGTGASSLYGAAAAGKVKLPNGEERVLMGAGGSHALGTSGGEATVTLTEAQMPAHTHTDEGHTHTPEGEGTFAKDGEGGAGTKLWGSAGTKVLTVLKTAIGKATLKAAGSGTAHNNLQPFTTANLFIHV